MSSPDSIEGSDASPLPGSVVDPGSKSGWACPDHPGRCEAKTRSWCAVFNAYTLDK